MQKTGGGSFSQIKLNGYEESVKFLHSMKTTSSSSEGSAFGFSLKQANSTIQNPTVSLPYNNLQSSTPQHPQKFSVQQPTPNPITSNTNKQHTAKPILPKKRKHSTISLLEEQVNNQKKLIHIIASQNNILNNQNNILLDLVNVLKEKLK